VVTPTRGDTSGSPAGGGWKSDITTLSVQDWPRSRSLLIFPGVYLGLNGFCTAVSERPYTPHSRRSTYALSSRRSSRPVSPCVRGVAGTEASDDIVRGIERLPEIADLDLVIVGRGGGSPEDLWGFNTEAVARAILDCPVPVISAVGHEVDVTIADLVADHRSPTPTAAGEEAAPELSELRERVNTFKRRMRTTYRAYLDRKHDTVRHLAEQPVMADLAGLLQPFEDTLDRLDERLRTTYRHLVSTKRNQLDKHSTSLESLNPRNVLERGYGLIQKDGQLVTTVSEISQDDQLLIQWSDGSADVVVQETQQQDQKKAQ